MTRHLLLAGAALTVAAAAVAAPDKGKKPAQPATIKCAVMTGRTVNVKTATVKHMFMDYKGRRYFFCCGMCPSAFKADPAKYAKNASLAIPKVTKSAPAKKA